MGRCFCGADDLGLECDYYQVLAIELRVSFQIKYKAFTLFLYSFKNFLYVVIDLHNFFKLKSIGVEVLVTIYISITPPLLLGEKIREIYKISLYKKATHMHNKPRTTLSHRGG